MCWEHPATAVLLKKNMPGDWIFACYDDRLTEALSLLNLPCWKKASKTRYAAFSAGKHYIRRRCRE